MSPRQRATFAKRQKEQARQEKQRAKAERKRQRKLESQSGGGPPVDSDSEQFATGTDGVSQSADETATEPSPAANPRSLPPSSHNLNAKEFS